MANILPPAKINPSKLLGGSLVTKKISSPVSDSLKLKKVDNILIIKQQVFKIRDLVKDSYLLKKAEAERERKRKEREKFGRREEGLEKKPDKKDNKLNLPETPKLGFLDRIKNFIFNTLLGYVVVRLIPHLPKLFEFVKMAAPAFDFIVDMSGKLFDGLVTFIDKGYEAYDFTRKTLKSFGGDNALKLFDAFNGTVGKLIEASIIAALAFGELSGGGDGGGRGGRPGRGFDTKGRRVGVDTQRRYAQKYGRDEFIKRFGKDNLKNLPKSMQRGALTKFGRNAAVGLLGKGGVKTAIKIIRPLTKGIPIIGGLIEFGLALLEGDSAGKAAFKAVGSTLFGAIGAALGGPFAIFTGIGGSMLGAWAADKLYDALFNNKKEQSKVKGKAGGGITRGGRYQGSVKRSVKKVQPKKVVTREVKVEPTKLKPGSSVGGEKKVETAIAVDYSEKFYDKTSDIPFFGPIFSLATKAYVGDTPKKVDYKNAGAALNSWINTTFNAGVLRGGMAYAEGGEVNAEMLMKGEDLTQVIAKSLEESVSKKIDDALNDLKNQMMLGPGLRGIKDTKEGEGEDSPNLEVEDGGTVTGGNADFWTLVAIASLESGTPQGRADVAQSIYNRLASGIYSGGTIKELVVSGNGRQYQPVGRAVREFRAISDKESAINAVMVANKLNRSQAEKFINETASAIQNKELQASAAQFVGGRTDFWAQGLNPPSNGIGYVVRHGHRFGWFVGPAAIAYGKKNPGPAKAPALGDIIVMGGGGAGGMLGGGKFIQGNSGASAGVHFHIGPGSQVKGTILQRQYFADARATAKQAIDFFLSKGSKVYDGRRGVYYKSGNEVGAAQQAHTGSGSAGGIDMQVDFEKPVPFPLKTVGMMYRPNGFGVSADIAGSNSFVAHGRYDEKGRVAPQERMKLYARGGFVRGLTKAILGERGIEFVLDTDTTSALEQNFPGFLSELNKADYNGAIQVLRSYASYEVGASIQVEVDQSQMSPTVVTVPVPMPFGSGYESGSSEDPYESMAMSQ